jgi:peptidylamidoglycolate lyase
MQVAVALDGTVFVSDGYCNSRVVKFSADGKYLGEWEAVGLLERQKQAAWPAI